MAEHATQTAIQNEHIVSAQPVSRAMTSSDGQKEIPGASHSGTVVETDQGNSYLVHKGPDFTPSNPTAIASTDNMSNNWSSVGDSYTPPTGITVGSMADNGPYNVATSNCNDATSNQPGSTVEGKLNISPK